MSCSVIGETTFQGAAPSAQVAGSKEPLASHFNPELFRYLTAKVKRDADQNISKIIKNHFPLYQFSKKAEKFTNQKIAYWLENIERFEPTDSESFGGILTEINNQFEKELKEFVNGSSSAQSFKDDQGQKIVEEELKHFKEGFEIELQSYRKKAFDASKEKQKVDKMIVDIRGKYPELILGAFLSNYQKLSEDYIGNKGKQPIIIRLDDCNTRLIISLKELRITLLNFTAECFLESKIVENPEIIEHKTAILEALAVKFQSFVFPADSTKDTFFNGLVNEAINSILVPTQPPYVDDLD